MLIVVLHIHSCDKKHNNVIEPNNVETKIAEFFEHAFPFKIHIDKPSYASSTSHAHQFDDNGEIELGRSKRVIKETKFGNDFHTFLDDNDSLTYSEPLSSLVTQVWKVY